MDFQIKDAQAALNFVTGQTEHIEAKVYKKQYPTITYTQDVTVDTSAHPYATSVRTFTQDQVGKAKFINGHGDDVPLVNINRDSVTKAIKMGGIGYSFSLEEIGQAQMMNMSLSAEGAQTARLVYELFLNELVYFGVDGSEGLFGITGVATSAANAAWTSATADQILADVNDALTGIQEDTNGMAFANTINMPLKAYNIAATKNISSSIDKTILEHIRQNNVYTSTTGQPLTIRANTKNKTRLLAYDNSDDTVKLHLPMALDFLAPQPRNLEIYVPGMFRVSELDVRQKKAMRYVDGVATE